MDSVLVAFSGGADSSFLLKAASLVLPKSKILAVTASSATFPREELALARNTARGLGIKHMVVKTEELKNKRFISNPVNRCYFCKKELFSRLKEVAEKNKLDFIIDASNVSDRKDFRPGNKAKYELGIRSPLQEANLTKREIRILSRRLGLKTWNKPALACLASRFPYGTKISKAVLNRIDNAEAFLRQLGFRQVRLRHHNGSCRIEVFKNDIPEVVAKRGLITQRLKRLGYNYISVDLEGYRTGSLNEVIK